MNEDEGEQEEAVNEDVMSGSRYSISNENCKIFVDTISDVKLLPQDSKTPVSQDEIDLAKECSKEMTKASDELKAEMEKISQMPADPNYNSEEGKVTDQDLMREKTPKEGQTDKSDKVVACVNSNCQFKSAEQKAAYDAAMSKYKESTQNAMSSYKEKKSQLGSTQGGK